MKRFLLSFILVYTFTCLFAQDTVWLNGKGKWLKDSIGANRYAVITPQPDNNYLVEFFNMQGKKQESGYYAYYLKDKAGRIKQGTYTYYDNDGNVDKTLTYKANRKEGESTRYYPDGSTHILCHYSKNKLEGEFLQYYQDGKLRRKEYYKEGECTGGELFGQDGTPLEHQPYEVMPEFPGGIRQLMILCARNIHYPKDALRANASGKVLVEFFVNKEGNMENFRTINRVYPSLEDEAIRVLQTIGQNYRWSPAYQDGEAKRVKFTVPVLFRL